MIGFLFGVIIGTIFGVSIKEYANKALIWLKTR